MGRRLCLQRPSALEPLLWFHEGVVGNIPICQPGTSLPSQETIRSYDMFGSFMELKPNYRPKQSKYNYLYCVFYVYVIYSGTKILKVCFCFLQLQVLKYLHRK